jgi:hypothetical protein
VLASDAIKPPTPPPPHHKRGSLCPETTDIFRKDKRWSSLCLIKYYASKTYVRVRVKM